MNIKKCDVCGAAEKPDFRLAYVRTPDFSSYDVCLKCAERHGGKLLKKLGAAQARKEAKLKKRIVKSLAI